MAVVQDHPKLFLQKDLPALMMASMGVQVSILAILTLTSRVDVNGLTRSALVLETRNSSVSLVTNLDNKVMFVNCDVFYTPLKPNA